MSTIARLPRTSVGLLEKKTTTPTLFEDTLLLGIAAGVGRLSMVLFRYLAIRGLEPATYGSFALMSSLFVALLPLAHLNIGTGLVYLISTASFAPRQMLRAATGLVIACSAVCGVLLLISMPKMALAGTPLSLSLLCPLGFFASAAPTLIEGVLRGQLRIKSAAFITAASGFSRLILLLLLLFFLTWRPSILRPPSDPSSLGSHRGRCFRRCPPSIKRVSNSGGLRFQCLTTSNCTY